MNFSTLKLASFVALTFVCAHWMACGLYMITALEPHAQHTWLTEYNELAGHHEVKQHFQIYLVALYWSSMTMSTIGYGDVAPQTTIERVYVIGGIFLGASLYAYMVGAVCGIVAAMDPDESEFYGAMDTLNVFARRNKLPLKLQLRLREFARYQRVTRSLQDRPDLLDHMSENLSSEVAAHTQARWVRAVAAFAAMPPELAIEISLALGTRSFSPEEVIFHAGEPADTIFIVERGIVASRGHLLGPGGILGLSLYVMGTDNSGGGSTTSGTDRSRTWDHAGTTLTYANLLTLQRCHLASIMHRHPDAARALRQSVVRPLIQEGVLMFSRAARWVDAQRTAGAAVAQCVPHKAELGGDFVTDRRLHKVLGLLLERQPRLFRPLLEACIVIQSQWRGFKARRLAQHMRETIGRLALQRRVAKLSKRLRAAGFIYSTIPSSGPRKPTPSADAAAAVHTSRGVTLDTATSACVPQSCTGGASAAACSAWVNIREQVTSLATDVAAMHALLRRIAGPMAAAETAAAVVMAAE